MNFSIVFDKTGDSIPFKTTNTQTAEVLCYYVNYLDSKNLNKFSSNVGIKIKLSIEKLHSSITECNAFIYELLDSYIDTHELEGYLNQTVLNKLHADWVNSQFIEYNIIEKRKQYNYSAQSELIHNMYSDEIPVAVVGDIVNKLGLTGKYNQINLDVHNLERLFSTLKFNVTNHSWVEFNNPFEKNILNNDISNFSLSFNHLGRTLYNKFMYHDYDLEYNDENSYNQLLGFVDIALLAPQTIPLSIEYVAWCKQHNKVPSGDKLNIGNIPDLTERLTEYRIMVYQNTLQSNCFSIQLNKGN
jgi:hypothetical protein